MRQLQVVRASPSSSAPITKHQTCLGSLAQPELADAAQNNPARFGELLRQTRSRQMETKAQLEALNENPYDIVKAFVNSGAQATISTFSTCTVFALD